MEGQDGVVRLDDGIGHLRRRDDGVRAHDTIRVFLTDLGDEERSHTTSGTTTEGVDKLESLEHNPEWRPIPDVTIVDCGTL